MSGKMNRGKVLISVLMIVCIIAGFFLGVSMRNDKRYVVPQNLSNTKLSYLLSLIEHHYVDSVNTDSIVEKVIPHILAELDPHTTYIPMQEMSDANEALDGQFDGIGVVFNMMTDTVVILNVITGGPSFKAGVMNGDRIIKVGDSTIAGRKMPQDEVVKMLRGKRGTDVTISVERAGIDNLMPITVTRGVIPIKSIDASFMIDDTTGFVKLSRFSRNSYEEMFLALVSLKSQGMKRLIFDLRSNSGGFLDQAIRIANEFLGAGRLIVYTENRYKTRSRQYTNGAGQFTDIPMIVLIDEGSASSSEILAGAMQDNDRAVIIGRRSFGKGLVQEQVPFYDGSAVRLTVARYFTPTGRSIQKPYEKGDEGNREYGQELLTRYNNNEFFNADSIHFDSTLRFITPAGRIVYGGGGIMPDKFIPADTTRYTPSMQKVVAENLLYRFALEYSDRHRKEFNEIKTLKELDRFYSSHPSLYDEFLKYVARHNILVTKGDMARDGKTVKIQLKAIVGRNTPLEENAFYYYIAPIDNTMIEALNTK